MSIAIAVKHMLAAGMDHAAIVSAVAEMEQSIQPQRTKRQERNARYYEKRKEQASKTSESVLKRLNSDDSDADPSSPLVPPLSPTPPNPPYNPPNTPLPSAGEGSKSPRRPKQTSRKATRLPDSWAPTAKDYAFASQKGLKPQEINDEADRFRNYWTAKSGAGSTKLDWSATWRNWITSDFGPLSKRRKPPHQPGGSGGLAGQFARFADEMGRAQIGSQARNGYDPAGDEGVIIDAQPIASNW